MCVDVWGRSSASRIASANVDFPRSLGPYSTFKPGPNSTSASRIAGEILDVEPMNPHGAFPDQDVGLWSSLYRWADARVARRFSASSIRFLDDSVKARHRVLDDRQEGRRERCRRSPAAIAGSLLSTSRTPGAAVSASVPCSSRKIRSTSLSSDSDTDMSRCSLTTCRSRSGSSAAPQLVHVTAPHVEPSPKRHGLRIDPRTACRVGTGDQCDVAGIAARRSWWLRGRQDTRSARAAPP